MPSVTERMDSVRVTTALWMNFPEDARTIGIDAQFMWGSSILFSPVLVT